MAIRFVNVTPTVLNADAYDAGDTLFDVTAVPLATSGVEGAILDSLIVVDADDQAAANMTLWFFDSNPVFGVTDAAPSITDANTANILGYVTIASAAFLDVTGSKVGQSHNIGMLVKPAAGSSSIYVAATTAGTPTQTTGGVRLRLGFRDA